MNSSNVSWKYNKLFYIEVNRNEYSFSRKISETIPIETKWENSNWIITECVDVVESKAK